MKIPTNAVTPVGWVDCRMFVSAFYLSMNELQAIFSWLGAASVWQGQGYFVQVRKQCSVISMISQRLVLSKFGPNGTVGGSFMINRDDPLLFGVT